MDGRIGLLVDPSNSEEISMGIKEAVRRPRAVPEELEYFSYERFVERWHEFLDKSLVSGMMPEPSHIPEETGAGRPVGVL